LWKHEDTLHSDNRMMQGFFLRSKGFDNAEGLSKLKWQNISSCYDSANAFVCGTRKNGVAYWSPELAGFSASSLKPEPLSISAPRCR
jgi:hypothetical protein